MDDKKGTGIALFMTIIILLVVVMGMLIDVANQERMIQKTLNESGCEAYIKQKFVICEATFNFSYLANTTIEVNGDE